MRTQIFFHPQASSACAIGWMEPLGVETYAGDVLRCAFAWAQVEATVKTMMKSLARDVKLFRLTDVEDSLERLHQDLTYTLSTEQPQLR